MAALLTEREAAQFLGVSPGTLRNWRSSDPDRLPALRNGRMIRYDAETVARFFEREVGANVDGS